jgi:hypothetical protein
MRKAAGNRGNQANDPIVCKYVRRMAREKVLIARNNTSQISVSDLKFPPTIKVDHISNFSHLTPRCWSCFMKQESTEPPTEWWKECQSTLESRMTPRWLSWIVFKILWTCKNVQLVFEISQANLDKINWFSFTLLKMSLCLFCFVYWCVYVCLCICIMHVCLCFYLLHILYFIYMASEQLWVTNQKNVFANLYFVNYHKKLYRVSKKTLWKFNRLLCITNLTKQFNFYIERKNSYLAFLQYLS